MADSGIVLCRKCGKPVTWFNYTNIWECGKIVTREHQDCSNVIYVDSREPDFIKDYFFIRDCGDCE